LRYTTYSGMQEARHTTYRLARLLPEVDKLLHGTDIKYARIVPQKVTNYYKQLQLGRGDCAILSPVAILSKGDSMTRYVVRAVFGGTELKLAVPGRTADAALAKAASMKFPYAARPVFLVYARKDMSLCACGGTKRFDAAGRA
jgi:hypothetical protein